MLNVLERHCRLQIARICHQKAEVSHCKKYHHYVDKIFARRGFFEGIIKIFRAQIIFRPAATDYIPGKAGSQIMTTTVIVGAQWGDEGKGKITDWLAQSAEAIVRYAGGNNAGHTVITGEEKYELHLIPSGILHEDRVCLIGNGVVVDPFVLEEEMEELKNRDINLENLYISKRAHLVLPGHKKLDNLEEERKGEDKIGTTGRGIGPTYTDKAARRGIRVLDILEAKRLEARLRPLVDYHNKLLIDIYGQEGVEYEELKEKLLTLGSKIEDKIVNAPLLLNEIQNQGQNILLEGAQGTLLDIDFGTYPYVTSSNPGSGGATSGSGIGPACIDEIIGVSKAYITRVGEGPMPTELTGEIGEKLRQQGGEFGVTTGRPRRCGWLDLPALRHAVMVNGLTALTISKIDVLNEFEEIKICTHYTSGDEKFSYLPAELDLKNEESYRPVYTTLEGWQEDITGCQKFSRLPAAARRLIEIVETETDIPVKLVSTGPDRNHLIDRYGILQE